MSCQDSARSRAQFVKERRRRVHEEPGFRSERRAIRQGGPRRVHEVARIPLGAARIS
jgi:hypothetical protein